MRSLTFLKSFFPISTIIEKLFSIFSKAFSKGTKNLVNELSNNEDWKI